MITLADIRFAVLTMACVTVVTMAVIYSVLCVACTINMTNTSSVGEATDQVDTKQDANATVDPNLNIPLR